MWRQEFTSTLQRQFNQKRDKNPRYSIRAYASYLQISHAALSQILRGTQNWKLTVERANEILGLLKISADERNHLLNLMGLPCERARQPVGNDRHELITDWRFGFILCCHDLEPSERTPEKIAKRLGLAIQDVEAIVEKLIEKDLLTFSQEKGCFERKTPHLKGGDGPSTEMIRSYHKNCFTRAVDALESIEPHERDFTTMTFAGSAAKMEELRREIRSFHERVVQLMNRKDENNEVFQFSIGFFPVRSADKKDLQ